MTEAGQLLPLFSDAALPATGNVRAPAVGERREVGAQQRFVQSLQEALAEARMRGLRRVTGHVSARNPASLAACARAGLVQTGLWWTDANEPFFATEAQLREVAAEIG